MESLLSGEHAAASRMERGEFEGILVGFSTTVDEEQLIVIVAAEAAEPFCQLLLQTINNRIAVEAQLTDLTADSLNIMRMSMANGDDGMTAIKVQIFFTILVPDATTFAAHNVDGKEGIDVE